MIRTRKNAARPQLEWLDMRELPSASPAAMVMPTLSPAVHVPLPTTPQPLATVNAAKPAAVVFDGTYTVSVITVQNKTTNTVNSQLQWTGTPWKSCSLKAGESHLYSVTGSNQKALIGYDSGFQAGFQDQKYSLPSRNFTA